jgi:hypothetical protein
MRLARLVTILLVGPAIAGCVTAPVVPDSPPPAKAKEAVRPAADLWDADREALQRAFEEFAASPGTTPAPRFAVLMETAGDIRFASAPPGWKTWREDEREVREITLTGSDFGTYIRINPRPVLPPVLRDVRCGKGKGNTDYMESRYILTRQGWVEVEFRVSAYQATLAQLLAHLRKHYGEYEGVCQQVQKLAP